MKLSIVINGAEGTIEILAPAPLCRFRLGEAQPRDAQVEVPEPGAPMDDGLKVTVTPMGWPLAERAMAELKPPPTIEVMVEPPLLPRRTETEPGEADTENDGTGGPVSAAIRPLLGLPQPVTRSKPVTAE